MLSRIASSLMEMADQITWPILTPIFETWKSGYARICVQGRQHVSVTAQCYSMLVSYNILRCNREREFYLQEFSSKHLNTLLRV